MTSIMNDIEFHKNFIEYCEESATFGERNNNGADSYNCPSCYASEDISGYCGYTSGIHSVKHEEYCTLMAMYKFSQLQIDNLLNPYVMAD